jgi:hypothetical protein
MPAATKDVTISVSGMTITVEIDFVATPGYDPVAATVTVKRPDGGTDDLTGKGTATTNPPGAKFQDTVENPGSYDVKVVCSDATFGNTVSVPGTSSISFHHVAQTPEAWRSV